MPSDTSTREDKLVYLPILRKRVWERVHRSTWKGEEVKHGQADKIAKKVKVFYEKVDHFSLDVRAVKDFMNGKKYSNKTADSLCGFLLNDVDFSFESFKDTIKNHTTDSNEKVDEENTAPKIDIEQPYLLQVKDPLKTGMVGGALSGVGILFLTVIFKNHLGYDNLEIRSLNQLLPIMFLSYVILGLILGWISSYYSYRLLRSSKSTKLIWVKAFLSTFVLSTIFRGLKARDSNFVGFITGGEQNGLLGEPNFEVLATSLAMALCVVFIMHANTIKKRYLEDYIMKYSLIAALSCSVTFSFIFIIFKIMILTSVITNDGYLISKSTFKFTFSHPERVIWIFLSVLISVYAILKMMKISALSNLKT